MSAERFLASGKPMANREDFRDGKHVPCGMFARGGSKRYRSPDGIVQFLTFYKCDPCDAAWIAEPRP